MTEKKYSSKNLKKHLSLRIVNSKKIIYKKEIYLYLSIQRTVREKPLIFLFKLSNLLEQGKFNERK